jgi:hypothetical protein
LVKLHGPEPPCRRRSIHGWIVTQALGVVHVLISSEATKHRLTQQTDQCMVAVLARARVGECLACHRAQPKRVVEFAVRQQSRIGRDHAAAKLHHQAAVEIELESPIF